MSGLSRNARRPAEVMRSLLDNGTRKWNSDSDEALRVYGRVTTAYCDDDFTLVIGRNARDRACILLADSFEVRHTDLLYNVRTNEGEAACVQDLRNIL